MNRQDALTGALVADTAAMGLHWLYDQEQIKLIEATGSLLFRNPEAAVFENKRGSFVHKARRAGELSHYGESARIVGDLGADYSVSDHLKVFMATFGPCGTFHGYADRPTKQLVAKVLIEGEKIAKPSGMDDDQMPGLCVVPGLFAADIAETQTVEAAKVISINTDVESSARAVHSVLSQLIAGVDIKTALATAASAVEGELGELMRDALGRQTYEPLLAAQQFGMACYVKHSMPLCWHLLNHATDFKSAVLDNIRCGGDCCGRSMALGSIAGLVFGVPDDMRQQCLINV